MSTTINNDSNTGEDFEPDDFYVASGWTKVIVTGPGFACDDCEERIGYEALAAESPDRLTLFCKRCFLRKAYNEGYDDLTWDDPVSLSHAWWNS